MNKYTNETFEKVLVQEFDKDISSHKTKDLQKENGYFDGNKTTQLMILQFPYLQGLVLPDIRPIDFFRLVDNLIGLDKIGEIIQVWLK